MQVTVDWLTQNYSLHNFITWKSRDKTRDKIFTTPPSLGWISIVQCTYSLYNITGMLKGGGGVHHDFLWNKCVFYQLMKARFYWESIAFTSFS